jgi:hypothetical protein
MDRPGGAEIDRQGQGIRCLNRDIRRPSPLQDLDDQLGGLRPGLGKARPIGRERPLVDHGGLMDHQGDLLLVRFLNEACNMFSHEG